MTTIRLHNAQAEVIHDLFGPNPDWRQVFEVVVGSRGLGKSYVAGTAATLAVGELEQLPFDVPNKNISILCGTHTQVRDIYFPLLANTFGLEARAKSSSRDLGRFEFHNGTELVCRSAETYERMRGTGQYFVIGDEMPTWTLPGGDLEDAWESVIEPCITTRWSPKRARELGAPSPGRALLIASPKGKDYFYELSQRESIDNRWRTRQYDYTKSPLLDQDAIRQVKLTMDPLKFSREYEASFNDSGARVYYTFDRNRNIRTDLEYFDPAETVHASIDFNVFRNCTAFHAIRGGQIFTLDELEGSANTEELALAIRRRFPKNKIICYPDPAGKARKTSAPVGVTDFTILQNAGFEVLARAKAPAIVDSVAAVNRLFHNAAGDVNWYISHQRCNGVIKSLDRTTWLENRPDSATIDKTQDIEHFTDGLRYFAEYLFPIGSTAVRTVRSFTF